MSQVRILCAEDDKVTCDNCDWTGVGFELEMISDFEDRIYAGEPCPAGQCPTCGALAHLKEQE